ncbi:hypothetical protein DRN84_02060 [Candidatus Geothermarchaeota archaeon]|nr:MAG: hypothetical protein DRN87_04530 [Candidatus Geothermarchaeota archaeon]RLG62391.1 MAG: hypothetical protein DRN84_02060 [Candidatus Geothermarchaeota archaeon]
MSPSEFINILKERFGDKILSYKIQGDKRIIVKIDSSIVEGFASFLKESGFDMPITMGATDFIKNKVFEIFYGIWSSQHDFVILFKYDIPRDNPCIKTLVNIWSGVQKFERETWELLGINIDGHPNLKPLLLPEDWNYEEEGYPLRKDFNLKRYIAPWGDES